MAKIVCRASDCVSRDEGICSSDEVTYDPEDGCLAYGRIEDVLLEEEDSWEDDADLKEDSLEWEEDDELLDEDEDDAWD